MRVVVLAAVAATAAVGLRTQYADYDKLCKATANGTVPEAQTHRRKKVLLNLHFQHGAGTYFCHLAKVNCERVWGSACNHYGDGGTSPHHIIVRDCAERRHEITVSKPSFVGLERGILSGEWCPDLYDYVVIVREPVSRHLSRRGIWGTNKKILDALRELLPLVGPPGAAGAVAPADVGRRDSILSRLRDAEEAAQVAQLDNFYTRALAANTSVYEGAFGATCTSDLDTALARLETFKFVTSLDYINDHTADARRLFRHSVLGWTNFSNAAINEHHAGEKAPTDILSTAELALLADLNELDRAVWAYADRRALREGLEVLALLNR